MDIDQEQPIDDLESVLSSVAHALVAKKRSLDASMLSKAIVKLECTGFDNWDGGTSIWSLYISIPYPDYLSYSDEERKDLETFLDKTIKPFLPSVGHWVCSEIIPLKFKDTNWRKSVPKNMDKKTKAFTRKIDSFLTDLNSYDQVYEIERWQGRINAFLVESKSHEIADKLRSYFNENDVWGSAEEQKGYLEAFLINIDDDDEGITRTLEDSRFWLPNHFKFFLSHLSIFKVKTAQLQKSLKEYGISGFVAHEDIEPTKEWQDEIENALYSMDALGAILTPKFNESQWADQEVGVAAGRQLLIIPILKGLNPYGLIGKYQGLQGEGRNIGEVAQGVFEILSSHSKTREKMAFSLTNQILLAGTEQEAIKKLTLLGSVVAVPDTQLERIRDNCRDNANIFNSTEFIERLNKILTERNLGGISHVLPSEVSESIDDIPF